MNILFTTTKAPTIGFSNKIIIGNFKSIEFGEDIKLNFDLKSYQDAKELLRPNSTHFNDSLLYIYIESDYDDWNNGGKFNGFKILGKLYPYFEVYND